MFAFHVGRHRITFLTSRLKNDVRGFRIVRQTVPILLLKSITRNTATFQTPWLLLVWGVLVVCCIPLLNRLQFDYDIEQFFPEGDEEVGQYDQFRKDFENENDYLLVAISRDQGVFDTEFLKRVDLLTDKLTNQNGVQSVESPTNYAQYSKSILHGYTSKPLLHIDDSLRLMKDREILNKFPGPHNMLFSEDFKSIQLVVKIAPYKNQKQGFIVLKAIKQTLNTTGFSEAKIAGRLQTQWFYVTEMRKEMVFFGSASFLLLTISLFLVFRRMSSMVYILLGISLNLLIIFGIIGLAGQKIHLMLSILPAIVLIIGTSSMIHFLERFEVNFREIQDKSLAIGTSIKQSFTPLFFNALTTAIGFWSLWLIPVAPIKTFGLYAGTSVMIGLCITFFFLPLLIRLTYSNKVRNTSGLFGQRRLMRSPRKPSRVIAVFTIVLVCCLIGMFRLKTETFFLNDLSSKSHLKKELLFFENHFNGIRPLELTIDYKSTLKQRNRPTLEALKETEKLEKFLMKTYGAKQALSPVTVVKSMHQAIRRGKHQFYALPDDEKTLELIYQEIDQWGVWEKKMPLLSAEGKGRISFRTKDLGSTIYAEKNQQLVHFLSKMKHADARLTGVSYLMDKSILTITDYLIFGILTAILISTVLIFFMTRSIRMALVSLIPNMIPLVYAAALMSFLDIPLNISTATVFTIIYGIAVDDTMHFVYNYSAYRKKEGTINAIQLTTQKVALPMMYTSVVLFIGFILFAFSSFQSIFSLGIVVSSSMIVALLSDLFLLPALLRVIDRS